MAREYASIVTKVDPLQQQLNLAVTEKTKIDIELSQEETLLDVLRSEMDELEDRMASCSPRMRISRSEVHQDRKDIATSSERRRSLPSNIERYEKEKVQLRQQEEDLGRREEGAPAHPWRLRQKSTVAEETYRAEEGRP